MHTDLLSEQEVSQQLGVPLSTLRWWRSQGRLGFIKLGRHVRFRREEVERFVAEGEVDEGRNHSRHIKGSGEDR